MKPLGQVRLRKWVHIALEPMSQELHDDMRVILGCGYKCVLPLFFKHYEFLRYTVGYHPDWLGNVEMEKFDRVTCPKCREVIAEWLI